MFSMAVLIFSNQVDGHGRRFRTAFQSYTTVIPDKRILGRVVISSCERSESVGLHTGVAVAIPLVRVKCVHGLLLLMSMVRGAWMGGGGGSFNGGVVVHLLYIY